MADDRDARIAQLEAEVAASSQREAALVAENVLLAGQRSEALQRQAATADVLRVIASSPTDAQPVLDAIVESARRLSGSAYATLNIREGDHCRTSAIADDGRLHFSVKIGDLSSLNLLAPGPLALVERRTIHLPDRSRPAVAAEFPDLRIATASASVTVPLIHEGDAIGYMSLVRDVAEPFSPREIALIETFADTAAIAIAHARLFSELEQRNAQLQDRTTALQESNRQVTEALEQQTATAEVLRVIAASPTDLQPVLDTLVESAARLCDAEQGHICRPDGEVVPLRGGLRSYARVARVLAAAPGSPGPRLGLAAGRSWSGGLSTSWTWWPTLTMS